MKANSLTRWVFGMLLASLPLVGGCLQQNTAPLQQPAVTQAEIKTEVVSTPDANESPEAVEAAESEQSLAEAPIEAVSTARTLPDNLHPSGPVAEVIKLVDAGVDESVLITYITNSTSTFNLGAAEIIYLNDIGMPNSVITMMIQQDQTLSELARSSSSVAFAPGPPVPPPQAAPVYAPAPVPEQSEPQPPPVDYAQEPYPSPSPGSDTSFDNALAPYGTWVDVDRYGRCWQPTVAMVNPGWQPYFDSGRWVYTDCGWYWLSDYSWGWAPFHYGRWFRHAHMGWCWAPDTVWGPSWVSWRYSNDYCGWAPLPPYATYSPGAGLCYRGHTVGINFNFGLGVDCYAFVPLRNFRDHHLKNHEVPRHEVAAIYNRTVVETRIINRNRTVINHGIAPERVAAATRSEVRKVAIHEVSSPAAIRGSRPERLNTDGKSLTVYRPQIPDSRASSIGSANTQGIEAGRINRVPSSTLSGQAEERRHATQIAERTTTPPEMLDLPGSRPQHSYDPRPSGSPPQQNLSPMPPGPSSRQPLNDRSNPSTAYSSVPHSSVPSRQELPGASRQPNIATSRSVQENRNAIASQSTLPQSRPNPSWQAPANRNAQLQSAPSQGSTLPQAGSVQRQANVAQRSQVPPWMQDVPRNSTPSAPRYDSAPIQAAPRTHSAPSPQTQSSPISRSYSQPSAPSYTPPSAPVRSVPSAPASSPSSSSSRQNSTPGRNPR